MSNLKRALSVKRGAVEKLKNAQIAVEYAELEVSFATQDVGYAVCARKRLRDTISVIEYHRIRLKSDHEFSCRCAKVLISAYKWNKYKNTVEIVSYVSDLMPWLSRETIFNLIPHSFCYSNKEAADMMQVTLAIRQELGLTLFNASDLSEADFNIWRENQTRENDRVRSNAKRRAEGKPTREERKAYNASKKAYYERLAVIDGCTPGNIYRKVREGKYPAYDDCKNEIRTSYTINSTDATFAKDQAASAHQARSEPNMLIDDTEFTANAALALTAAASPKQKKTPAVSDKGTTKQSCNNSNYSRLQRPVKVIVSEPECGIERAALKPTRTASIINIDQRREQQSRLFNLAAMAFGSAENDTARHFQSLQTTITAARNGTM